MTNRQPFVKDRDGVVRFKENKAVRILLDAAQDRGFGLNDLARLDISDEDRRQLAQLIGYSLVGYHELSYVSDDEALAATEAARAQGFADAAGCRDSGCKMHSRPQKQ